ncbi:MAG: endonuclease VIII, partial [Clostridia bacterium]|nr:endonuclease VIII [Clostridia bacterium]
MYGGIHAFVGESRGDFYYDVAVKKPNPLSDAFTYEYFMSIRNNCKEQLSAKVFLATEQRIPGLGNGVLQDILYLAGIHPKKPIGTISEDDFKFLYDTVRKVLSEMTEQGGRD